MGINPLEEKIESLFAQIKEIAFTEYQRGAQDALGRVLSMVQTGEIRKDATFPGHMPGAARTPRGAARPLIERVLKLGPHTIREIREAARTDTEKLVSYQAARLELERGKKQKRYKKNSNGQWSLSN
ncbi:MAG TPA: hypothetical protein VFI23_15760 [Rhizomicrobium sp.]|nr:hypothetical protein [Rhizomicrobium sp.]